MLSKKIREEQQELNDDYREILGVTQMNQAYQVWTTLCKWCIDQSKNKTEPIEFRDLLEAIEEEASIEYMSPENLRQIGRLF